MSVAGDIRRSSRAESGERRNTHASGELRGCRGPKLDYAQREAFAKLIAEGVPSAISLPHRRDLSAHPHPRSHGRQIKSGGRAGPLEGTLIMGAGNASAIVTVVERTTRFTLLGHLPGARHDSTTVRDVVVGALSALPAHLRRTLTWDQGSERARHTEIAETLATTGIYF
jgi:hypothetical protein